MNIKHDIKWYATITSAYFTSKLHELANSTHPRPSDFLDFPQWQQKILTETKWAACRGSRRQF